MFDSSQFVLVQSLEAEPFQLGLSLLVVQIVDFVFQVAPKLVDLNVQLHLVFLEQRHGGLVRQLNEAVVQTDPCKVGSISH